MNNQTPRSKGLRAFNALCATCLIGALIYLLTLGVHAVAVAAMLVSIAAVAVPLTWGDGGILEVVTGTIEAIIDGLLALIEGMISAVSGLFS